MAASVPPLQALLIGRLDPLGPGGPLSGIGKRPIDARLRVTP